MKTIKNIPKTIEEHYKIDRIFCDICKNEIREKAWELNEIDFQARIGSVFPESDCRIFYELDVCVECFMGKLKPLVEEKFDCKFKEYDAEDKFDLKAIYKSK